MNRHELRLNCTRCGSFEAYDHDTNTVVRCAECGKRHSTDSVWLVDPDERFDRDESGALLETPY